MQRKSLLAAVEQYYNDRFATHGATAQGVDWKTAASQELRFEQLAGLFRDEEGEFSVNDLGCGYGAFARFLRARGTRAVYAGYDVSAPMIAYASESFRGEPEVRFVHGVDLEPADYSVASGVYNVKLDVDDVDWEPYVHDSIHALARASTKGFAFNMLTSYSDPERRRPDLYYADPSEMFDLCKRRFSANVALLHDYGLWEFTVIVRTRP